jgi:site-specific recombinase XerC
MAETGIRLSEITALSAGDLELDAAGYAIRRGKGGRGRIIPIGAAIHSFTSRSVARSRTLAGEEFWLGERSCGLASGALHRSLRRRAERWASRGSGRTGFATPAPPLARCRRLRVWPDGDGRLDPSLA